MDYKVTKNNSNFDFSVAQIINEKENKKMSSKSSLDEKLSDLVGASKFEFNENISLNYNFSIGSVTLTPKTILIVIVVFLLTSFLL